MLSAMPIEPTSPMPSRSLRHKGHGHADVVDLPGILAQQLLTALVHRHMLTGDGFVGGGDDR